MKKFWIGFAIGFIGDLGLLFLATVFSQKIFAIFFELVIGISLLTTLYFLVTKKPYKLALGIFVGSLLSVVGLFLLIGTP